MTHRSFASKKIKAEIFNLAVSGADRPYKDKHPLGTSLEKYLTPSHAMYDPDFKNKLQELRPDWFKRHHNPKQKKEMLLELASSGAEKPSLGKHALGKVLTIYVNPNSVSYDPEFRNKLWELRPDWFEKKYDGERTKTALLELALSGADKPLQGKHPLGNALRHFIRSGKKTGDLNFTNKLREIRPDWFERYVDPEAKKSILLQMAASGAEKPLKGKHKLTHVLTAYVSPSSSCYDPEFKNKLQELRPDWFQSTQTFTPKDKKSCLLKLASSGVDKPIRGKHPLGGVLSRYIDPNSSSYDSDFRNKLQELRPDWFRSVEEDVRSKKDVLLQIALSGQDKPTRCTHPLGAALVTYVASSSKSYDLEFKKKLEEIRPDWFTPKKDVVAKKKAGLLKMASLGEAKPLQRKHPLGNALRDYTAPNSACYDPDFKDKLQELRPDWFMRQ